eukprot:s1096_g26.t1
MQRSLRRGGVAFHSPVVLQPAPSEKLNYITWAAYFVLGFTVGITAAITTIVAYILLQIAGPAAMSPITTLTVGLRLLTCRCDIDGQECVQYGIALATPRDEKYVVKHLNERYKVEFGCRVSLRGRKRFYDQKLVSRDQRKCLRASLYPCSDVIGRWARLKALAAAEQHFDAVIRDMLEVGSDRPSARRGSRRRSSGHDAGEVLPPALTAHLVTREDGSVVGWRWPTDEGVAPEPRKWLDGATEQFQLEDAFKALCLADASAGSAEETSEVPGESELHGSGRAETARKSGHRHKNGKAVGRVWRAKTARGETENEPVGHVSASRGHEHLNMRRRQCPRA